MHNKSVKDWLQFLSANKVREWSSCGVIFLGAHFASLTSPVICNLASKLKMYQCSFQILLQFGFAGYQLEVALWHRSCQDQLNVACLAQTKLTNVGGPMLIDAANRTSFRHLTVSTWGTRCSKQKSRFDKFLCGHSPHTQLCCSTHKFILLTNVTPFKGK